MKTRFSITTKKNSSGQALVTVFDNKKWEEVGKFETNDMELVDDIREMNNDGFESHLVMHETFEEVVETCLNRL